MMKSKFSRTFLFICLFILFGVGTVLLTPSSALERDFDTVLETENSIPLNQTGDIVWDFGENSGGTHGWSPTSPWGNYDWDCDGFWGWSFWVLDSKVGDPMIVKDGLYLDNTKYWAVELRLRTNNVAYAGDAIFWTTSNSPSYSGDKAKALNVTADEQWHTIQVRTNDNPNWMDYITALRIDPVGNGYDGGCGGDGDYVHIDWVKVLYDDAAPTNPTSVSPGCTADSNVWQKTCNDPNFTWSGASDAHSGVKGYYYYWGTSSTGNPTTWTTSAGYNPGAIPSGSTYYLRVKTEDNSGRISAAKTLFILKYDGTAPTSPSISSATPAINQWTNDNTIAIAWTAPSDATGYSYVWDYASGTTPDATVDTTAKSITSNALNDGNAYFHIRAVDAVGNWSGATHYGPFKIDATAPAANFTAPMNGSIVTDTVYMKVQANDSAGNPSGIKNVVFKANYGGSTYTLSTDSSAPYEYTWDITSLSNQCMTLSATTTDNATNSDEAALTICKGVAPNVPPQNVQASTSYTDKIVINWDAVAETEGYEVWRGPNENPISSTLIADISTTARNAEGVSATSYADTTARAGTTYLYRVKAKNTYGTSDYSLPASGYYLQTPDKSANRVAINARLAEGTLIKGSGPAVYLYTGTKKRWISSPEAFLSHGYKWEQIVQVEDKFLDDRKTPNGPIVTFRDGTLLKGADPLVYVMANGKKRPFCSGEIFLDLGYKWNSIMLVSDAALAKVPTGTAICSVLSRHPNGTLIKTASDATVYEVRGASKQVIPHPSIFESWGYNWDDIVVISDSEMARYLTHPSHKTFREGTLLKSPDSAAVYVMDDKSLLGGLRKRPFPTWVSFLSFGYDPDNILEVPQYLLDGITSGNPMYTSDRLFISGQITNISDGLPLAGVKVYATGQPSQYTDSNGNYQFPNLSDGVYTIRPVKFGYKFAPQPIEEISIPDEVHLPNATGQNFTAQKLSERTLPDGKIYTPQHNSTVNASSVTISATAWDNEEGVEEVKFYAYYNNKWQLLGSVRNPVYGHANPRYEYRWHISAETPSQNIAIAINVIDKAGNVAYSAGGIHTIRFEEPPLWPFPYVHQLWSTQEDFNGHWACGPSSTAMSLAWYQALAPTTPLGREGFASPYSWYVANPFSPFDTQSSTEAWGVGDDYYGLYGYILDGRGYASMDTIANVISKMGLEMVVESSGNDQACKQCVETVGNTKEDCPNCFNWSNNLTHDKLVGLVSEGKPVIMSTGLCNEAHIVLVRGYNEDNNKFIVSDPFGQCTNPAGKIYDDDVSGYHVEYSFADMRNDNYVYDPERPKVTFNSTYIQMKNPIPGGSDRLIGSISANSRQLNLATTNSATKTILTLSQEGYSQGFYSQAVPFNYQDGQLSIPMPTIVAPGYYQVSVKPPYRLDMTQDMPVYGETITASFNQTNPADFALGDIDYYGGDNAINGLDVGALLYHWQEATTSNPLASRADLNEDGLVDEADLEQLHSHYGLSGQGPSGIVEVEQALQDEATLELLVETTSYTVGDTITVQVYLNSSSPTYGAEVSLYYDPTYLALQDADASLSGLQIKLEKDVYPQVITNHIDSEAGSITFFSHIQPGGQAPSTGGLLATLTFEALAPNKASQVAFDFFPGLSTDSNILSANQGQDSLVGVNNLTLEIAGDDTLPPSGTIFINEDEAYTNQAIVGVTLNVQDDYSDLTAMRFSDDGQTWDDWEAFAYDTTHFIPEGDGVKTIYVEVSDAMSNTTVLSNSIILDTIAPTGTIEFTGLEGETDMVYLITPGENSTDIDQALISQDPLFTDASWGDFIGYFRYASVEDGHRIYARLKDKAGNISEVLSVEALIPSFEADTRCGTAPLEVSFSNQSLGDISKQIWSFGDGLTSTLVAPVHTYAQTGSYTVSLQLQSLDNSYTLTRSQYIQVLDSSCAPSSLSIINEGPDMLFDGDFGAFVLTATQSISFTDLAPDVYSISEEQTFFPEGEWHLSDVVCEDDSQNYHPISLDRNSFTAYIPLDLGQNITCTFSHRQEVDELAQAKPELSISLNGPSSAAQGDIITYTLTVRNSGLVSATNVVISNIIPANANYISGGNRVGDVVEFNIDILEANGGLVQKSYTVSTTKTLINNDYGVTSAEGVEGSAQVAVVTIIPTDINAIESTSLIYLPLVIK